MRIRSQVVCLTRQLQRSLGITVERFAVHFGVRSVDLGLCGNENLPVGCVPQSAEHLRLNVLLDEPNARQCLAEA